MILTQDQRRCNVCGYTVYGRIWFDDPPNGECPYGWRTPIRCRTAMDRAALAADLIKAGVVPADNQ